MKVVQVPQTEWEPVALNIVFETAEELLNFHSVFNIGNQVVANMVTTHTSRRLKGDYEKQFNTIHNATSKIKNSRGLS